MSMFGQASSGSRIAGLLALALAIAAAWATAPDRASAYTGINKLDIDVSTSQAGGHPNIEVDLGFDNNRTKEGQPTAPIPGGCHCDDVETISLHFPTGFIGNPHAVTRCEMDAFVFNKCPPEAQVGIVQTNLINNHVPLINLKPRESEAGLVGFYLPLLEAPQFQVLKARTGSDYGLDSISSSTFHAVPLNGLEFVLWGVPAAESNDTHRFPPGVSQCTKRYPGVCSPPYASSIPPEPFLQNPTQCDTPLSATLELNYYSEITETAEVPWPKLAGCDLLSFNPSLSALPTTKNAESATGLDVNLKVPQTQSPTVPTPSQIRSVKTTLPEGLAINPGAADGKQVCSDQEARIGTEEAPQCHEHSKVGTVRLDSSALPGPIDGGIYLGTPKPGDPYPLLLTASGHATNVKLRGSAEADPTTGQLTVNFPNLPQSPFSEFDMHFFGSERALLVTPKRCGSYPVHTEFAPWSSALGSQESTSVFTIDSGPGGKPCPGAQRPFSPRLTAGTEDNTAGSRSPMSIVLSRDDGDQNFSAINVKMPEGFTASLRGIPYCPESAIATLKDDSYDGKTELASPACPQASRVGTVLASTGAGTHPLHSPGVAYLAGPYNGAPLSLIVSVPAVSGPYDLGNVAVRVALNIDRTYARITAVGDSLPRIIEGVPLDIRQFRIDLDRPNFAINPTNCNPLAIGAEVFGSEGSMANPESHFQVANCRSLYFKPTVINRLSGATKRTGHPALSSTIIGRHDTANTDFIQISLPNAFLVDNQNTIVCDRKRLAEETCPPETIFGRATVGTPLLDEPLAGNVYLAPSNSMLPDILIAFKGQVDLDVRGTLDTYKGGVRATFREVPDVPFDDTTVNFIGGKRGLLENRKDLCKLRGVNARATANIVSQNGTVVRMRPKLKVACASSSRKAKRKAKRAHRAGKGS